MRPFPLLLVPALLLATSTVAPAVAQEEEAEAFASDTMTHVANLPYELAYPDVESLPYGTDLEFAELTVPTEAAAALVQRVAGSGRVQTAAAVSAASHDAATTVVVATGDDYADALAGAPLAAELGAPLLLTPRGALADEAADEIRRLGATDAVLLGGPAALSDEVEGALRELGLETRRVRGPNRFATAVAVMAQLPASTEVVVAEGQHSDPARGWPDALSAAGLAAAPGLPVLLVTADRLPDETAAELDENTAVTVVGGRQAVSDEVLAAIDAVAGDTTRLSGATRYETSALAARAAVERGASASTVWVATGTSFADGLVAGAAVGAVNGLLLLVDGRDLDASPQPVDLLREVAADVQRLVLVGGESVITPESEQRLREAVGATAATGGSTEETDAEVEPVPEGGSASDNQILEPGGSGGATTGGAAEAGTKPYAIAGTEFNGLQIIDISDPTAPKVASVYDCGTLQGDVQVFRQGDRTYATYASEDTTAIVLESRCVQDNVAAGRIVFEDANGNGEIDGDAEMTPAYGTYVADITNPLDPQTAGFIPVPEGSHNGTVHPSGRYFYNSNSSLIVNPVTSGGSETTYIEYYDISDVANPVRLGELPLPVRPGLGTESHDITFAADGTRAYSAALSNTVIIDTTDPAAPEVITSFEDPAVNVEHQSDPIDVVTEDGVQRRLVIVQDELAGAAGNGSCPGGGLHIWDVTNEALPTKVGVFFIDDFRPAGTGSGQGESVTCTSHVYRLYPEHGLMTIAWYNAGVRVLDISGLADAATSPVSMPITEVGSFYFSNSDTWSFKTNLIEEDGSFYGYGNDIVRGFDVYRYTPAPAGTQQAAGRWLTPEQALAEVQANPPAPLSPKNPLRCLLPRS